MDPINRRQNSQEELEKFKKDIDLVDYAQKIGYQVDHDKDSKNYRALKKDNDVVIVSKLSTGQSWYFNQHDPSDKGSIIDFVKTRQNASLGQTRQLLRDFSNSQEFTPSVNYTPPTKPLRQSEEQRNEIIAEYLKADKTLTDRSYLHSRGISDDTLDNQAFKGRIFNTTVVDKEHNKTYVNTAFPIYNKDGMISLEQKNKDFKAVLENTPAGNGVWISNNTDGDKSNKLDKLVITESGEDALSHHQLHYQKGVNTIYVSTSGNNTQGKTEVIQELIDKRKPAEVVAGVDNDPAGSRYRINFLNSLQPPREYKDVAGQQVPVDKPKDIEFKAVQAGKFISKVDLVIRHADAQQRDATVKNIREKIWDLNYGADGEKLLSNTVRNHSAGNRKIEDSALEQLKQQTTKESKEKTLVTGDEDLKWEIVKTSAKETHIRLEVKNQALPLAEELVKDLKQESDKKRGIEPYVVIHKPQQKDFNDDLKLSLSNRQLDQSKIVDNLKELEEKSNQTKNAAEEIGNKAQVQSSPEQIKDTAYQVNHLQTTVQTKSQQIDSISQETNRVIDTKMAEVKNTRPIALAGKPTPAKEYHHMLDEMEGVTRKEGTFDKMKEHLEMYRKHPHLTDEEVDNYVALKEKISKDTGPEKSIESKKQYEID
jgi:hypothetical protein